MRKFASKAGMKLEKALETNREEVVEFFQLLYSEMEDMVEICKSGNIEKLASNSYWNNSVFPQAELNAQFRNKFDVGDVLFTPFAYWEIAKDLLDGNSSEDVDSEIVEQYELDSDADEEEVLAAAQEAGDSYETYDQIWLDVVARRIQSDLEIEAMHSMERIAKKYGIPLKDDGSSGSKSEESDKEIISSLFQAANRIREEKKTYR